MRLFSFTQFTNGNKVLLRNSNTAVIKGRSTTNNCFSIYTNMEVWYLSSLGKAYRSFLAEHDIVGMTYEII